MARRRTKPATAVAGIIPLALGLTPMLGPPRTPPAAPLTAPIGIAALYPDSERTPGVPNPDVRQDNIADNLCSKTWSTSTIRPPASYTSPLKVQQMKEYGDTVADPGATCMIGSDNPKCYEEDHLISLENGGDPKDPMNLWPEPYNTQVKGATVGARQKDLVEGFIHDEICFAIPNSKKNGHLPAKTSVTLARAHQILTSDWYSCYVTMQGSGICK